MFLFPFLSYLSLYYRVPFPIFFSFFVKGHPVSFRVWVSGRDDFRRVFSSVKDGCGTYFVLCITSVDFVCPVP